jgi:preprotein translocase subunit SecB
MKKNLRTAAGSNKYESFLRDINLYDIHTVRSSTEVNWRRYHEVLGRKRPPLNTLMVRCELSDVGEGYFNTSSTFRLTVRGGKSEKALLTIDCTLIGHFHTHGKASTDLAQRFAESDSELLVFPYFRQFVFDTTARMSIPPITVPLLAGQ